ncbi:plasma membrane protein [Moniliophthora roreri MCA 2997]|uniref:Plasma membrane protein n=1 Tax=Moniliophthora roreri (strain MCA 2997) TaxID=1381753 RepID=V2XT21_MONRO|nr:plasma membrane protein [Moniliophthora roreri MCA 2997]
MDNPGWHAHRRAQRESDYFTKPQRGPDGRFYPVEQVTPMDESFIGGFHPQMPPPSPVPPALPPKDGLSYDRPGYRQTQPSISASELTKMSAIERSKTLRIARMNPHLQFMVGPLLRYDTVDDNGIWHGAALIVTADSGSIYEPHPTLTYEWDPDAPVKHQKLNGVPEVSTHFRKELVPGQEIWVYGGAGGTFTFWRFMIHIPLSMNEMAITYSINNGQKMQFYVPGQNQNMRWATHSCNGFSAGVNPDDFRGPGFQSGYDPCWMDLLLKHNEQPFHALIGGGDQLYCDALTREPELQGWVAKMKPEERKSYPLTPEIAEAIDRFYFSHYCKTFRSGAFARANSSIPMMNMCDDHGKLIDGFGSYPEDMQTAPVFKMIGARGYFFFLLFQCFINVEVDGINDQPGAHINRSIIIGDCGPYVDLPSHSFLSYLGPQSAILLLDCRAERKKDQVCSQLQYQKVFERIKCLPPSVEHLVVQLGVPIAYPRMVFLESALESKLNPLVALGKSGSLGLSGFVNKFNADAELLDDLNDHWTSRSHKRERNWFIEELQKFALAKQIRITFLSGDVHCAAVGLFKTLKPKNGQGVSPLNDHRYMVQVVTSAIVNTPPPNGVITMVSSLATKTHKTLHHIETDEVMLPIFTMETDDSPRKQKYIMGKRNWCMTSWDESTGDLIFDIRVEKEKGCGHSKGYVEPWFTCVID